MRIISRLSASIRFACRNIVFADVVPSIDLSSSNKNLYTGQLADYLQTVVYLYEWDTLAFYACSVVCTHADIQNLAN
jgi:hypothetical protein